LRDSQFVQELPITSLSILLVQFLTDSYFHHGEA
jgi:hypothetical protein